MKRKKLKVLITSGGTKIPIDDVRHISNMSSGTFGAKIAYEALKYGHNVTFLCAKDSKTPLGIRFSENDWGLGILWKVFKNFWSRFLYAEQLKIIEYNDFGSYSEKLYTEARFNNYDVVVLAAAASDYGVVNKVQGKIRSNDDLNIQLKPLPKLISRFNPNGNVILRMPKPKVLVGFKLLVGSTDVELLQAAKDSVEKNGCDMVVANDLRDIKEGKHRLMLVFPNNMHYTFKTDHKDPNYLAREVVKIFTNIEESKRYYGR